MSVLEKNRFIPQESGRLLTAFLERFFERYVSFDFTAHLEDELDDISGGRAQWQAVLEAFWRDFKPKTAEMMEQKPSRDHRRARRLPRALAVPRQGRRPRSAALPGLRRGRLALRGGRFGAFVACSNYPECKFTRRFGQGGEEGGGCGPAGARRGSRDRRRTSRCAPAASAPISSWAKARRPSAPRSRRMCRRPTSTWRCAQLAVAAAHGRRPSGSGKPITAIIGRYGPYLAHDGKYARLGSPPRCSRPA